MHELMPALLSPLLVWPLFGFRVFDGASPLRTDGRHLARENRAWRDHEPEHDSIAFFRPTTWDEARRVQCPGGQPRDCAWPSTAG
ncbi:hypothetical protein ACFXB4_01080 [Streptomyces lavendulae]|uniref:hypothetical protein n=1 Tax=Streptomyces lavendulae TaxID=1914 RepID=UPI0036CB12EF